MTTDPKKALDSYMVKKTWLHNENGVVLTLFTPEVSAYNASFVLAKRLKNERGCRVVYLGPRYLEDYIIKQGFEYCRITLGDAADQDYDKVIASGEKSLRSIRVQAERYIAEILFMENRIREYRPNLILLDPLQWKYSPAFLRAKTPMMGFNTTLAGTFDMDRPPVFSSHVTSEKPGVWERSRNLIEWVRIILRGYRASWREDLGHILCFGPLQYRRYQPKALIAECGGKLKWGEYGFRLNIRELVACPREFDVLNGRKPISRFYIGACVDGQRKALSLPVEEINPARPLVYCSLGTYSHCYPNAKHFFRRLSRPCSSKTNGRPSYRWGTR